ncbi:Lamin Tail Domain [Halogranum rubrum]|uniref:Lamin Tail Domain n=1 Tax=Halogranum rubrum TaxID=553466 RepID=A0A1I4CSI3_9EURY|nr:lamin tail domain-containing protein [Halogranum rubrum]SFK83197.1 Lamin Tail Domain [Halogranum rubrum]
MNSTRRTFLAGVTAAATGLVGTNTVLAQEDSALRFATVDATGEYVVVENTGDSPFDLSGYYMEFEYKQNVSQSRQFPSGTVVDAGGTLTIASGAKDVADADVTFGYEGSVINDEVDYLAILEPDESTVVVSYRTSDPLPTETATPEPTPEQTETAEPTPEETATETPESEPTETAEPTPEETETAEPTPEETTTETPDPEPTETPESTPEETESPSKTPEKTPAEEPEQDESPVEEDGC